MALSPRPSIPGTSPGSSIPRMAIALIYDHVGTNPIVTSEWPSALDKLFPVTDRVPPFLEWQLLLHLSYSTEWPALISDMEGSNPLTMIEWLSPYI